MKFIVSQYCQQTVILTDRQLVIIARDSVSQLLSRNQLQGHCHATNNLFIAPFFCIVFLF